MNDPNRRSVVITGMGVTAPNGCDLETFWSNIRAGHLSADWVKRFDCGGYPSRIAVEVEDFEASRWLTDKQIRRMDRYLQFGVASARQAMVDSGLTFETMDPDRCGIVEATSLGGLESTLKADEAFLTRGYRAINPMTLTYAYSGGGSGEIALELGIEGHAITYCSGSCSGNDALGYALQMIRDDETDVMLAGGAEAPLIPGLWGVFCRCKVMSRAQANPRHAMRPFDRDRDGFVLGEGAAFLVLEEKAHALSRGARIYAEVAGHGRSCEAYHSVLPHPEGRGMYRAMEKALRSAGLHAGEVDYINVHGTATESNDVAEARAVQRLLGDRTMQVGVSSTKPMTGHLLGASGALETIVCAQALQHRELPASLNLDRPSEDCQLDFIRGEARPYPANVAMNLSSGFGGKNACLILRRHCEEP